MKTSKYPVLDNRPIDQWRVTELKEELKKRKLTTKGLKEDLVRRLVEAIHSETEVASEEENNGVDISCSADDTVVDESVSVVDEIQGPGSDSKTIDPQLVDDAVAQCNINDTNLGITPTLDVVDGCVTPVHEDQGQQNEALVNVQPEGNEVPITNTEADVGSDVYDNSSSEMSLGSQRFRTSYVEKQEKDSGAAQVLDDIKPSHEDEKLELSDSIRQVSEVSPSLGFQVSYDSITSDSLSINQTNDLKDNIIADDVKLEHDFKPEMVQPASNDVVSGAGETHPVDVEEPYEYKVSVEQTYSNVTNTETSKKNDSADLGSPEKLNLDRSSGDDSMEEEASASRQIDSTYKPDEVGVMNEESEIAVVREDDLVDSTVHDLFVGKKGVHVENCSFAASTEKRKLSDHSAGVSEPSKRQRRWNSGKNLKVMEPNSSDVPFSTMPKDIPGQASLKQSFSLPDSNTGHDTPKERIVPPPSRSPTDSLKIDRFLRPFTLKAVQELLGQTGTVTSFWMDHIKTHCYVTYSTEEEAVKTRNALYNLQWPANFGRLLIAEFVEPEEVKLHLEPPPPQPQATTPIGARPTAPVPPAPLPLTSPRLGINKLQQLPSQSDFTLPPPPPLPNPPPAREVVLPPPPPRPEKIDPPIVTLDDLFRKTKATPRIYYLPLTAEQVQAKLEAQSRVTRQSASFASREVSR